MKWISLCLLFSLVLIGQCEDPESYLHDRRRVHNMEHIKEHMGEIYQGDDVNDQLKLDSEQAMEFHYFKLHDYDNNNKLDGLELGAAMTHFHEDSSEEGGANKDHGISISDDELATLIEQILEEDDLNHDGYVDYYEFINAQKRNTHADDQNL